ncbi:MAG: DUF4836 family protein [Bacteroidia bacterium]
MKRFLRISVVVILLLAVAGTTAWFFIMRRSVPEQAVYIPKDAFAVMTINVRALFLDQQFSGGHLFPDSATEKQVKKELEIIQRAIEKNDGSGLKTTADVLAFAYKNNDQAYAGLALAIDDSAAFGSLWRKHISKDIPAQIASMRALPTITFDSLAFALSWNDKAAILLYPIGNHSALQTAEECTRLLILKEEQAIVAVNDFKTYQSESFDVALWVNVAAMNAFTNDARALRYAFQHQQYLHFAGSFQKGVFSIHAEHLYDAPQTAKPEQRLLLPCDFNQALGYLRYSFAQPTNEKEQEAVESLFPFSELPFSHTELQQIIPLLDGNVSTIFHDTVQVYMQTIGFAYDENFEMSPDTQLRAITVNGASSCFGLKNKEEASKLIAQWMKEDSIPFSQQTGWKSEDWNGDRLQIIDNTLVFTNWGNTDFRIRKAPQFLEKMQAKLPFGWWLKRSAQDGLMGWLYQGTTSNPALLFGEHIGDLTCTPSQYAGTKKSYDIRLNFHNKTINSFTQLMDLFRKAAQ